VFCIRKLCQQIHISIFFSMMPFGATGSVYYKRGRCSNFSLEDLSFWDLCYVNGWKLYLYYSSNSNKNSTIRIQIWCAAEGYTSMISWKIRCFFKLVRLRKVYFGIENWIPFSCRRKMKCIQAVRMMNLKVPLRQAIKVWIPWKKTKKKLSSDIPLVK
jgi:hypothetical protein